MSLIDKYAIRRSDIEKCWKIVVRIDDTPVVSVSDPEIITETDGTFFQARPNPPHELVMLLERMNLISEKEFLPL